MPVAGSPVAAMKDARPQRSRMAEAASAVEQALMVVEAFTAEAVTAAKRLSSQAVMTAGSEAAGRFSLRRSRLIRNGRE